MTKIAIVGLGVMGAALARQLKVSREINITGIDTDQATLDQAQADGIIDTASRTLTTAIDTPFDLIILATPPHIIIDQLKALAAFKITTLIMDLGSLKTDIINAAQDLPHFVGGHPMVGTDHAGYTWHRSVSYCDKTFFLSGEPNDIAMVQRLLAPLEAQFQTVTPQLHDARVTYTSDLPHILADALVLTVMELGDAPSLQPFVGGGFRDTTRIAQANPSMWTDIYHHNATAVSDAIRLLQAKLTYLEGLTQQAETTELTTILEKIKTFRGDLL